MGLDQYLYAKRFYSGTGVFAEDHLDVYNTVIDKIGCRKFVDKKFPSITIDVQVGYWRKANQIHNWFVENVQDGEDNCAEYYVPLEKLEELDDLCARVLALPSMADELLPTQGGFFFGSTEYDEYYLQDLRDTREIIARIKGLDDRFSFYYSSSW
jgi:hypothetical protein